MFVNKTDSLCQCVQLLFAYIWVLNLQYPRGSKFVWEFVEKGVVKIGPNNPSAKILLFEEKLRQIKNDWICGLNKFMS